MNKGSLFPMVSITFDGDDPLYRRYQGRNAVIKLRREGLPLTATEIEQLRVAPLSMVEQESA
jgi:hypothetical protein